MDNVCMCMYVCAMYLNDGVCVCAMYVCTWLQEAFLVQLCVVHCFIYLSHSYNEYYTYIYVLVWTAMLCMSVAFVRLKDNNV